MSLCKLPRIFRSLFCLHLALASAWTLPLAAHDTASPADLFEERVHSVVYIEYFIQWEMERQPASAVGLVLDGEGLVVVPGSAMPDWVPPERFRDIRAHLPRSSGDGYAATFIGPDGIDGWYYLRLEEAARAHVTPISEFETATARTGDPLWGVCMVNGEMDYQPYLRDARLSTAQELPLMTGFATGEMAAPGAPVFNFEGAFVGWAGAPMALEYEMWVGNDYLRANIRRPDESHVFLFADELLENIGPLPASPLGDPRSWIGVAGLRPVEADTAEFLGIENRGAVVISEVLPNTPAADAGLQDREIVLAVDGKPVPDFSLNGVETRWIERHLLAKPIGSSVTFTVLREDAEVPVEVVIREAPKPVRAAERTYFEELGLTVRELTLSDALQRRVDWEETRGAFVSFVRPNSPPASAGLQHGDWIQEVDGTATDDFEGVVAALQAIEEREQPGEYVLLVYRNNETAVLRVKQD